MQGSINRPERKCDQVWIFLECFLKPPIVTRIIQCLDAPRDFKRAGETGNNVSIALAVQLNLAGLVLDELGLVPTLDRSQLVGAAAGQQETCEGKRREAHEQQDSQNNVEETDSSEFFGHSWVLAVQSTAGSGSSEAQVLGVRYYSQPQIRMSTSFNTDLRGNCGFIGLALVSRV
jgi:hypothetical protein